MSRRWRVRVAVVLLAVVVAALAGATAFGAATRRARAAMGDANGGPIERVQAVRSRPQ